MDVREKLIEILRKPIFPHELVDPTEAVADYLLDSGITVQEHGYWENANGRPKTYIRKCSVCGKEAYFCGRGCSYKFCPNCGCKMDKGE